MNTRSSLPLPCVFQTAHIETDDVSIFISLYACMHLIKFDIVKVTKVVKKTEKIELMLYYKIESQNKK